MKPADAPLYTRDERPARIDVSTNTNLWGTPPVALEAMRAVESAVSSSYPNMYAVSLKEAIANRFGVQPDNVLTGCGSDDVLDVLLRSFGGVGQSLVRMDPTFVMAEIFGRLAGMDVVAIRQDEQGRPDIDAMLAVNASVAFFCTPNNPTGQTVSESDLRQFLDNFDGVTIVDEAYAEFCDQNFLQLTRDYERLIVIRTMSKAFGLAGLRIGYAVGATELIAQAQKVRGPYKVSVMAESAACSVIADDSWVKERVELVKDNRKSMTDALTKRGFEPVSTSSNFVLVPMTNAADVAEQMRQRGVAVRLYEDLPTFGNAIRITLGPAELMDEVLEALDFATGEAGSL